MLSIYINIFTYTNMYIYITCVMYNVCTYDMMWCDIICYDTPYIHIYIYMYIHTQLLSLNYRCTHKNAWLVVSNILFFSHNIRDVMLPIDFHIFQDGYCTTNQCIWKHMNMLCIWIWWLANDLGEMGFQVFVQGKLIRVFTGQQQTWWSGLMEF